MKSIFKGLWVLSSLFILNVLTMPGLTWAEPADDGTTTIKGVIIIINDLIIVDNMGTVAAHVMKPDNSDLNVQTNVNGRVRVRKDGYWIFDKMSQIEFLDAKMYLTDEKTVPVTVEVFLNELGETETLNLPILIKGENDKVGTRLIMQVNGSMMAGILLPPKNKSEDSAKR